MDIRKSFEDEKDHVFDKLDLLHESIQNLHYEGKMSVPKNTRIMTESVQYLRPMLKNHIDLDEEIIFPFARNHIPMLEPIINFLRAERNEFIAQLESFDILVHKLDQSSNSSANYVLLENLREKGTYIVCIVRNHMQAESEGVYKVLDQRLKILEKKKLYLLIQKYIKNKNPIQT